MSEQETTTAPQKSEKSWRHTSVYLTDEDHSLIAKIMETTGISRSEVVRRGIRRLHDEGDFKDARNQRLIEIAEEIKRLA